MAATIKEPWEIDVMRVSGRIVATGLDMLRGMIKPGVSTGELDAAFEEHVRSHDALPTFKGYRGFPASICSSINEEVVHGIPSFDRILKEGDLLSIDCGATYKGYVGDSCMSMGVGKINEQTQRLMDITRESLEKGIEAMGPNVPLSQVSGAIQKHAEDHGYSIVRKYVGHGIGREMHEDPQVPNYVIEGYEFMLRPGVVLAIEPMLNIGTEDVKTLSDDWTVVTMDNKLSCHSEHTIAVTETGVEVLTRRESEKTS